MAQQEEKTKIYYDIELIDVSENIENFKFSRISSGDLQELLQAFKDSKPHYEFACTEGHVLMRSEHIRGVMYQEYVEKEKSVIEENIEAAEEISKVKLKKTVFNSTGDKK